VVQAGRVELELLIALRLAQAERARAGGGKPEVVDLLPALAVDEERRLEAERAEDRGVERERPLEVTADEVDVAETDEHQRLDVDLGAFGDGSDQAGRTGRAQGIAVPTFKPDPGEMRRV
jgi:hypothetical protein